MQYFSGALGARFFMVCSASVPDTKASVHEM